MSKLKLAILLALYASSTAYADSKYKRNQDVKVDVHLSDKVKPIQAKPQDKSEFKPELTADAVLSIEGLDPSRKELNIFGLRPPIFACSGVRP